MRCHRKASVGDIATIVFVGWLGTLAVACGGGHLPPATEPSLAPAPGTTRSAEGTATPASAVLEGAIAAPGSSPEGTPAGSPIAAARAETVEAGDARLAAALALVARAPTATNHVLAAREYMPLRIHDRAHEHLSAAIDRDSHDASAWEARARVWRDAGFLQQALTDAHRALFLAPRSAQAHNTLGTIVLVVGDARAARLQFEEAIRLDPSATHVLNNRCYALLVEGVVDEAVAACRLAVEALPELPEARNNLALAYAAQGDLNLAAWHFSSGGDKAAVAYNLGMVYYSRQRYEDAIREFDRAVAIRPSFNAAASLAQHARRRLEQARTAAARP